MNRRLWRRIIVACLAVFALMASLPWALTAIGNAFYASGNYDSARTMWQVTSYISFYERDVILLDAGDAAYQVRDYQHAAELFEASAKIATNDHFCMATYNWGQTLADMGSQVEQTDKATALQRYAEALRIISVVRCTDDPEYKDKFEALRLFLLKKIAELSTQPNEQQQPSQGDDSDSAKQIIEDHSQETAQQRQYEDSKQYYDNSDSNNSTTSKFAW